MSSSWRSPVAVGPVPAASCVRVPFPALVTALALLALAFGGCGKEPGNASASENASASAPDPETTGALLVKSNRDDATLEVTPVTTDGSVPTPIAGRVNQPLTNLPAGKYAVVARSSGWPETSGGIDVVAGRTNEATMNFKSGSLNLESIPTGAMVRHGGAIIGQTPMLILQLPAGQCELTLEYPTWPAYSHKVAIGENQESSETVRLPHGRLTVDSVPAGAQIRLDGRVLGKTPLVVEQMPAGPKRVILQGENYPQVTVSFTLQDGADFKINPELGSVFPLLDATELMRTVWVPDDPNKIAPSFDSVGRYEPKNGIVKNLNRQKLFNNWLGKKYRFAGAVRDYDPRSGEIEFTEQSNVMSKYRLIAKLSPEARLAKDLNASVIKGSTLAVYGQLTAVEEPRWPSKVITLELSLAEVLKTGSSAVP